MRRGGPALSRRLLVAGGCALLAAPKAFAHRAQSVLSTVEWNPKTSTIDVTHRMHAHDAELGLAASSGSASDVDLTQVRNQARLGLYVEDHFILSTPAGKVPLEVLGAEIEAEIILIYQEARLPAPPQALDVDNRILRDVFDSQTNLVNVRMAKRTRTLIFAGRDGVKPARDLV
jgi:hypothetical protein